MTADLVAFLRARLDDDQSEAGKHSDLADWSLDGWEITAESEYHPRDLGMEFLRIAKARAVAEIDAKRRLLDEYERAHANRRAHPDDLASAGALLALHGVVKILALPYAGHPEWREEWRP